VNTVSTLRKTAVLVGTLYILAAVTSVIALIAYGPVLHYSDYILKGAARATRVASGAFLESVLAFSIIGISLAMFPILRRRDEGLALGYACFRLLEATIIIVGIISVLSVVTLSREYAKATAPDAAAYLTAGRLLVAQHNWTFLFGPDLALGPSTLIMGYFLFRSRLVPRFIAVMGLVGGPLVWVSAVLVMFNVYDQVSMWGAVTAVPVFAYEMTFAVWLIAKGFDPSALAALRAQPSQQSQPAQDRE
jgi:hypothetical protein